MPQINISQPKGKTTTSIPTKTTTPAVASSSSFSVGSLLGAVTSLVQNIYQQISRGVQAGLRQQATIYQPLQSYPYTPVPPDIQQRVQTLIGGGGGGFVSPIQTVQKIIQPVVGTYAQSYQIQKVLSGRTGLTTPAPTQQRQTVAYTPATQELIKQAQQLLASMTTKQAEAKTVTTAETGATARTTATEKTTPTYSGFTTFDTGQTVAFSLTPQGEELFGLRTSGDLVITPQGTILSAEGGPAGVLRDPLGGSTPIVGHVIQPGETLSKIARQYGTTVEEILRLNQDNKRAIKSRDLIIAGEVIRVPYKPPKAPAPEAQVTAGVLRGQPKTAEEINKQALEVFQKYQALKRGEPIEITSEDVQPIMMYMFGDMMRQMQETEARYREILDPTFYQRQYQQFLEQSGIPELYQRYFDLNKILNSTRDDVIREALSVGGIVTQSQIEEVVNWRTSIIKSEMQTLADMIELKEKAIDRMMKFVEMDRKSLSDYFDLVLGINEKKQKLMMDAIKWNLDWEKTITNMNAKKLTTALQTGALADYSDELLFEMANPDSFLYTGYTLEELFALRNAARLIQEKKQEEIRKMREQLERQRQQLEISKQRLGLERERIKISRERLELQKQKEEEKKSERNKLESLLEY